MGENYKAKFSQILFDFLFIIEIKLAITCTITKVWGHCLNIRPHFCFLMIFFSYTESTLPEMQTSLTVALTHLSLASLLWDISKQNSPRCDAAERGVPSGAILFA